MRIINVTSLARPAEQTSNNLAGEMLAGKVTTDSSSSPDPNFESPESPERQADDQLFQVRTESTACIPVIPGDRQEASSDLSQTQNESANVVFFKAPSSPDMEVDVDTRTVASADTPAPIISLEPPASPPTIAETTNTTPLRVYSEASSEQYSGPVGDESGDNVEDLSGNVPNVLHDKTTNAKAVSGNSLILDRQGFTLDSRGILEEAASEDNEVTSNSRVVADTVQEVREPKKPLYNTDVDIVLGSAENKVKNKSTIQDHKISCFNCLGDHMVSNCKKPLNKALIKKRAQELRSQKEEKETRYHLVSEFSDQFKPGVISDVLRRTLGLTSRHHCPEHIWQMRLHGYPPGWLAHAAEAATSLKIYGSGLGNANASKDDELSRLIANMPEYPGFTSPVPVGGRDDGEWRGNSFNPAYRLENVARKYLTEQYEKRKFLKARRKVTETPSWIKPRTSEADFFIDSASQPKGAGRGHGCAGKERGASANVKWKVPQKVGNPRNWYDDLGAPVIRSPSPVSMTEDMVEVKNIYKSMLEDKQKKLAEANKIRDANNQDIWARHQNLVNYRMTEELERQVEEENLRKNRAQAQRVMGRSNRETSRSRSPSLLDPPIMFSTAGSSPNLSWQSNSSTNWETVAIVQDCDDDIKIVEVENGQKEQQDVIILDSDDEGANEPELLPNPFFKPTNPNPGTSATFGDLETLAKRNQLQSSTKSESEESPQMSDTLPATITNEKTDKETILHVLSKHVGKVQSSPFSELPPIDNFAKGMPEMPLKDERGLYTGRLAKVLSVIQNNKRKREVDDDGDDDDIQIIE